MVFRTIRLRFFRHCDPIFNNYGSNVFSPLPLRSRPPPRGEVFDAGPRGNKKVRPWKIGGGLVQKEARENPLLVKALESRTLEPTGWFRSQSRAHAAGSNERRSARNPKGQSTGRTGINTRRRAGAGRHSSTSLTSQSTPATSSRSTTDFFHPRPASSYPDPKGR